MTLTPIATRIKVEFTDGRNNMISGLRHDLTNLACVETAIAISDLQTNTSKFIFKITETELDDAI